MTGTSSRPPGKLRVGLIGCGQFGMRHVRALARNTNLDVVGLADPQDERRNAARTELLGRAVREYRQHEELIDAEHPDFVIVATQAPQHAEASLYALQAAVPVLCEKPLALDLLEADAMVRASEQTGATLAINHLRRMSAGLNLVRQIVDSGDLGEILGVSIQDKGGRPIGNTLMEMGTHYIDQVRYALDGLGVDIRWVWSRLSSGSGPLAHPAVPAEVVNSRVAVPKDRDCGPVLGQRGIAIFGFDHEVCAELRVFDFPGRDSTRDGIEIVGSRGSVALRAEGEDRVFRRLGPTWSADDPWQPVPESRAPDDPDQLETLCLAMHNEMAAAIAEGRGHRSSGRDGLAALEAMHAVYAAHLAGGVVTLPLESRQHPLSAWASPADGVDAPADGADNA